MIIRISGSPEPLLEYARVWIGVSYPSLYLDTTGQGFHVVEAIEQSFRLPVKSPIHSDYETLTIALERLKILGCNHSPVPDRNDCAEAE